MQRNEKNMQTKRKIMDSAVHEFALHGYEAASMNTICQEGGISKGIIYHYFESKEALYLACLSECFQALTKELQEKVGIPEKERGADAEVLLRKYFGARQEFFRSHADYARIFCGAVLFPPPQLKDQIREIRTGLDAFNDACLQRVLQEKKFREDYTEEEVFLLFHRLQDFVNAGMAEQEKSGTDIERHEDSSRKMLDIFFYGVLERK